VNGQLNVRVDSRPSERLTLSLLLGSVHRVMVIPRRHTNPPCAVLAAGLALIVLGLALPCCQRERKPTANVPQKSYRVDESLLGPAVTDSTLRLIFRPPSFFQPGHPERVKQIKESVRQGQKPDDPLAVEPMLIFGRPDRPGSVCTVSRFLHPPKAGMTGEWIELNRKTTRETVAPATVQDELCRVGDTVMLQLLIQNPQMVLFRVVCQGRRLDPVRIDYLVPRADYAAAVRSIESSLGSIRLF
jgi:hypothetical protein